MALRRAVTPAYDEPVTSAGYLRFPHIHGDLITFVADDDVWLAPAAGGRAWRVTADHAAASYPRISRDGTLLAWTSGRDGPPEVYLAGIDGGNGRRLSYWGDHGTRVCGWTPDGEVVAITASGRPFRHHTWAHALPAAGAEEPDHDGATAGPRLLPFGPVADLAIEPAGVALLTSSFRDPAPGHAGRAGDAAARDRGPGQDGEPEATPAPVAVDAEGLAGRIVQIPVAEARYSSLRAVKGGLAWLRQPVTGNLGEGGPNLGDAAPRPSLEHFDLDAQRCTELAEELDWFESSGDGSVLLVSDHEKLCVVPAGRKPDPDNPADRVTVDKSRARYLADPAALWRNAYAEAGRYIRHDFWVPDMAEVDWDGVLAEYRPLLDRIAGPGTSPT